MKDLNDDVKLARDVLSATLHGPVPMATVARLAEAVIRLNGERQWRPLTADPASWPERGTRMAIVDAADMTRFRIATRVHAPEQIADFIVNGWTHWLSLPPPPKGTHDR